MRIMSVMEGGSRRESELVPWKFDANIVKIKPLVKLKLVTERYREACVGAFSFELFPRDRWRSARWRQKQKHRQRH